MLEQFGRRGSTYCKKTWKEAAAPNKKNSYFKDDDKKVEQRFTV